MKQHTYRQVILHAPSSRVPPPTYCSALTLDWAVPLFPFSYALPSLSSKPATLALLTFVCTMVPFWYRCVLRIYEHFQFVKQVVDVATWKLCHARRDSQKKIYELCSGDDCCPCSEGDPSIPSAARNRPKKNLIERVSGTILVCQCTEIEEEYQVVIRNLKRREQSAA